MVTTALAVHALVARALVEAGRIRLRRVLRVAPADHGDGRREHENHDPDQPVGFFHCLPPYFGILLTFAAKCHDLAPLQKKGKYHKTGLLSRVVDIRHISPLSKRLFPAILAIAQSSTPDWQKADKASPRHQNVRGQSLLASPSRKTPRLAGSPSPQKTPHHQTRMRPLGLRALRAHPLPHDRHGASPVRFSIYR